MKRKRLTPGAEGQLAIAALLWMAFVGLVNLLWYGAIVAVIILVLKYFGVI